MVFLATNDATHPLSQSVRSRLLRDGFAVTTLAELAQQHPTVNQRLDALTATHLSLVEQIVAAYAHTFLGIFESSWDEYVYLIRLWLNLPGTLVFVLFFKKKKNYDNYSFLSSSAFSPAYFLCFSLPIQARPRIGRCSGKRWPGASFADKNLA